MKKMILLVLLMVLVMPLAVSQVLAAEEATRSGIVDAGNKICPISGGPVSGTSFAVYQGKRYGLCCPACEKPFLADPEKFISLLKLKENATVTATATPIDSKSEEMQKNMEQGSL